MEKALQTFEGLVRRSIAPSVTFFVVAVLADLLRVKLMHGSVSGRLDRYVTIVQSFAKAPALFTTLAFLVILGASYGPMTAQQVLFDNLLKRDFDTLSLFSRDSRSEGAALKELREKVVLRLRTEQALARLGDLSADSDYILYELLGGIDTISTTPFVDSAKATGIFFVSVIIVSVGNAVLFCGGLGWNALFFWGIAALCAWWGWRATVAQYRMRALRLYVNFLAMPSERLHRRLSRPDENKAPSPADKKDA